MKCKSLTRQAVAQTTELPDPVHLSLLLQTGLEAPPPVIVEGGTVETAMSAELAATFHFPTNLKQYLE